MSMWGVTADHRVSARSYLTEPNTLETAQVRRNPTESGMSMCGPMTSKRLSPKMAKSQDVVTRVDHRRQSDHTRYLKTMAYDLHTF